jgi:hypothetical protein
MKPFAISYMKFAIIAVFVISMCLLAQAQVATGSIHGQVTDPSGAAVVDATVEVVTPTGQTLSTKTNHQGIYELKNLAPGTYSVTVAASGFQNSASGITLDPGQSQKVDIALTIAVEEQKVEVNSQSTNVDVNPSSNASSIVLSGKDLDALSDDPDELQSDLEALAGPSAGPNGGQMYIDGFTAGQLPPKSAIREIRINQNPFSAEYDKLGYGRIEIFTKPGTDKFHGQFMVNGNSSAFNSPNPLVNFQSTFEDSGEGAVRIPPYDSTIYNGSFGGPLSKKASFFIDAQRRNINDQVVVSALVLDPTLVPTPFSAAIPHPRTRTNIAPRLDYQVGKNNTLTARYQFWQDSDQNEGIGQLSLPSQAYNEKSTEHTLQVSDTQIFGAKVINETRFQFVREANDQVANTSGPTISVLGAFEGGANSVGRSSDRTDRYELQNYTSVATGSHFLKFGSRIRGTHDNSTSTSGFNGTFTFSSLADYQQVQQAIQNGTTPAPGLISQYSVVLGNPRTNATYVDAGLYVQDDWRMMPNLTLSYGLRFETQNAIRDHGDWAPRVALAWGVGKGRASSPKTVLRAGFGMFYDRFGENLIMQAERLNGINQQEFVINNPTTFPCPASGCDLAGSTSSPTIYQIDPRLRAPYTMQSAISVEHQVSRNANFAVSYLNSRGVHQFLTRNINAPVPATGLRPFGTLDNIYQYESLGSFKQNQLIANVNMRIRSMFSLFGNYTLNYANSNTAGAGSFPSNQYNIEQDWGRSPYDARHRLFLGGTVALPYALRFSPMIFASSGSPFNVTVGRDLNGDSIFNDRPGLLGGCPATPVATIRCTRYGVFDLTPGLGGTLVPINNFTGPARISLNFRLGKTFGFGPKLERGGGAGAPGGPGGHHHGGFGRSMGGPMMLGAASDRRYTLTFSVFVRNALNHPNYSNPVSNLTSPLFGQYTSIVGGPFSSGSANRRIDLQAMFNF